MILKFIIGCKAECFKAIGVETVCNRKIPIIVSLTSTKKNLTVSLYSLLNQSLKPDKIILWLSDEFKSLNDLPYEITRFIKNGLEIRFVKDLGGYTKTFYPLKEFEDSIVVTAEEGIYYPKNWLRKLYYSYVANPSDIHVHCARRGIDTSQVNEENARYDNFPVGAGGILFPPKCFTKEALRQDIFLENAPCADDVWFWIMALLHNRKIRVVKNHIKSFAKKKVLHKKYDKELENLMKFYRANIISKLSQ